MIDCLDELATLRTAGDSDTTMPCGMMGKLATWQAYREEERQAIRTVR